ncbi:carbonic anhydrase [Basidiobolus meristosporus CBS 931.73]|uniref:Carbonic anhydrase n=1 Tax=Basidiobolus meristosporus CBS 931.73 TaxID=1314790 RepID=A0A1Y1YPL4_9FUNG|nr:carbonic anhydrase [Basidiobolus meristosporus CBS 931.73]ORX99706.1 carbonic anhydrase [Basidiobolus meristosporus CBS 931.73]|eukprot:ORX71698.1 carbonic anhydrase [Basidiobolus meristosporus CBS 931.73]
MILKFTTIALLSLQFLGASSSDVHWGYDGQDGPDKWALLSPEFATCKTGKYQSPIDLTRTSAKIITDKPLNIHWPNLRTPGLNVTNNGHTLQVNLPSHTNLTIVRDGIPYRLGQFHIHTPSEHHVFGKYFDMEIHFVLNNAKLNKNHVVGIVFEATSKRSTFLNQISQTRNIPTEAGHSTTIANIDFHSLFKEVQNVNEYWAYEGSLTTPPCTEGVRWAVARKVAQLSWSQFQALRNVIKFNARNVQ